MKTRNFFLLIAFIAFLSACSKYEGGPAFSLYTKAGRISGTWYFSKVEYGAVDSTLAYMNGRMQFLLVEEGKKDKGAFALNKVGGFSENPSDYIAGAWTFIADKDSIRMIVLNQIIIDTIDWRIVRLAYDSFWLESDFNDSTKLKFELWKWVM